MIDHKDNSLVDGIFKNLTPDETQFLEKWIVAFSAKPSSEAKDSQNLSQPAAQQLTLYTRDVIASTMHGWQDRKNDIQNALEAYRQSLPADGTVPPWVEGLVTLSEKLELQTLNGEIDEKIIVFKLSIVLIGLVGELMAKNPNIPVVSQGEGKVLSQVIEISDWIKIFTQKCRNPLVFLNGFKQFTGIQNLPENLKNHLLKLSNFQKNPSKEEIQEVYNAFFNILESVSVITSDSNKMQKMQRDRWLNLIMMSIVIGCILIQFLMW